MFESVITIAESWKQPKCPSMKEWISTMWSIYTVEYYAALKSQGNSDVCYNMEEP